MGLIRVTLIMACGLLVGAVAMVLFQGNHAPVDIRFWSADPVVRAPLWLTMTAAFFGGAAATGVVAAAASPNAAFVKLLVGVVLAALLWAVSDMPGQQATLAGRAAAAGFLLLLAALAWDVRGPVRTAWDSTRDALASGLEGMSAWIGGLVSTPRVVAPPPTMALVLLVVLLLSPVLLGSVAPIRAALALASCAAGLAAAAGSVALLRRGESVEFRTRGGSLGGGQGGWRLSRAATLVLLAALFLGAAVGLAPADRPVERPPPAAGGSPAARGAQAEKPEAEPQAKQEGPAKAGDTPPAQPLRR